MAYLHATSGHVLRVVASREAIAASIQQALEDNRLLEFETESQPPVKVTVNPREVTVVTEEPLPSAI